ncbi:hypothetical protein [Tsuneonella mangrovi]|uniref:hypothetical protein n=1 Tax=Tsuneonella mangrovi TaxID=1982042 RepID=UPI0012371A05|nr:hypothetical protein [Tsuneonella mangrovi]
MRGIAVAICLFALAGCGQGLTQAERQAQDAKDVAEVKAANTPPPKMITPQAILYPDIEKAGIYGASCGFVPDGGGLRAIAIAMEDQGYMKIDGEMVIFAADKGSRQLPGAAREHYDAHDYGFTLDIAENQSSGTDPESHNYPAVFVLRDGQGRSVFEAQGMAQCGS